MTIRLFIRWLNISYLTESNIINRIVQKETVVFCRWGEGGEINTKIIYNIRDTLALRYSKSVDCWLGECGLYNYRM